MRSLLPTFGFLTQLQRRAKRARTVTSCVARRVRDVVLRGPVATTSDCCDSGALLGSDKVAAGLVPEDPVAALEVVSPAVPCLP